MLGKSHVLSHIPNRRHQTYLTPPDTFSRNSRPFRRQRTRPTECSHLDNPSVVGSTPTGPTSPTNKAVTTTVAATIRGSFKGRTHRSTHTAILTTTYFGRARKLECFVRYRFEPLQPINEVAQRRPIDVESLAPLRSKNNLGARRGAITGLLGMDVLRVIKLAQVSNEIS